MRLLINEISYLMVDFLNLNINFISLQNSHMSHTGGIYISHRQFTSYL